MTTAFWKRLAQAALAFSFVFAVASCNTMEGAGEDIEEAGEETQEAAD